MERVQTGVLEVYVAATAFAHAGIWERERHRKCHTVAHKTKLSLMPAAEPQYSLERIDTRTKISTVAVAISRFIRVSKGVPVAEILVCFRCTSQQLLYSSLAR